MKYHRNHQLWSFDWESLLVVQRCKMANGRDSGGINLIKKNNGFQQLDLTSLNSIVKMKPNIQIGLQIFFIDIGGCTLHVKSLTLPSQSFGICWVLPHRYLHRSCLDISTFPYGISVFSDIWEIYWAIMELNQEDFVAILNYLGSRHWAFQPIHNPYSWLRKIFND